MSPLLQTAVSAWSERRPEARAVVSQDGCLSYGALEADSNRLAHMLRELRCRRGDRVALLMPKSPAAIVALLGVLKADAAYVPLDPAGPPARLATMLEACGCHSVLAAGRAGPLLRDVLAAGTLTRRPLLGWLDDTAPPEAGLRCAFSAADLRALPTTAVACDNHELDLAHILFTSGSTGVPKGVTITHQSVWRFLEWAWGYFGTAPAERISQHPPLHFDLSTFDIFGTLGAGAELHLAPPTLNLLPHKLAQFIRKSRLTQWFSVPSVLNLMAKFDVVRAGDFPELRRVLWCGEVIPTPTLIYWMERLPHAHFTNLYGPTEATIASSYYTVPRCPPHEQEAIPIGKPCDGEQLLILDGELQPVPDGTTGELYIGGVGLSPGYWNDAERTRSAFMPHTAADGSIGRIYRTGDLARRGTDGLIYFAGRKDYQIKSRGYRIELGEIEMALAALPELRESAVVALQSAGFEGAMICCAYVPAWNGHVATQQLRQRLSAVLPSYMLPARWLSLGTLPRNANGKVDRSALRHRFLQAEQRHSEAAAMPVVASVQGRR